jgi:UDP-GlcNAc:undecaprenyl-phosphate/decaprenyl-phosphate GlcNAc-1-phosphate transferase
MGRSEQGRACVLKSSRMVSLLIIAFVLGWVFVLLVLRHVQRLARHYDPAKPQRFHVGEVPRLGGLAIWLGTCGAWLLAALLTQVSGAGRTFIDWPLALRWCVVLTPAVLGGVLEDMTHRIPIVWRLLLTATTGALACGLLDLSLVRLDLPVVDTALGLWPWLGMALAVVAICGLPHAFNIIDGYNGLASMVAIMMGLAIAHVCLQLGDRTLAALILCMVGATAGFLVWNYPRGLVFAGDGGAYLWGVVLALACIALVQRHHEVSAWFPMLLLMYPVWETFFSVYRKVVRGDSPGLADALHFHQLVYRRIVRGVMDDSLARRVLMRNNRTSPWLWGFALLTLWPAVLFWNRTAVLMFFCLLFAVSYVGLYVMMVRFKVPRWLRR